MFVYDTIMYVLVYDYIFVSSIVSHLMAGPGQLP